MRTIAHTWQLRITQISIRLIGELDMLQIIIYPQAPPQRPYYTEIKNQIKADFRFCVHRKSLPNLTPQLTQMIIIEENVPHQTDDRTNLMKRHHTNVPLLHRIKTLQWQTICHACHILQHWWLWLQKGRIFAYILILYPFYILDYFYNFWKNYNSYNLTINYLGPYKFTLPFDFQNIVTSMAWITKWWALHV